MLKDKKILATRLVKQSENLCKLIEEQGEILVLKNCPAEYFSMLPKSKGN
jgi:hypothetical protein